MGTTLSRILIKVPPRYGWETQDEQSSSNKDVIVEEQSENNDNVIQVIQ